LKTFDGDLSTLERAIDFTLKKSVSSPHKSETVVTAPASNNFSFVAANVPREKRHIKDVVHGDNLEELPSSTVQEVQAAPVAGEVVEIPAAASGFCFRHIVEDTETVASTLQSVCNTPPVVPAARPMNKLAQQAVETVRVSRSVKDVVYGETDFDAQRIQSSQIKKEEKQDEPQIPAKHFKTCMREELSADSAPHARIAVKALVSEVSHHTHWRSAIHGF
jgi:hypothetical protein